MLRLGLAAVLGMLPGADREWRGMPAGLRTHMLITVGAATTAVIALELTAAPSSGSDHVRIDPIRMIEAVMTAIGFLGGGSIIQNRDRVRGLTTAANIWLSGTVGLACGAGCYLVALLAFGFSTVILVGLAWLARAFPPLRKAHDRNTPDASADR